MEKRTRFINYAEDVVVFCRPRARKGFRVKAERSRPSRGLGHARGCCARNVENKKRFE